MLVFAGIISVQLGAGLAGRMFSQLGPAGVTGLRLWWSALIVAVFGGRALARTLRQVVADRAWRDLSIAVAFGVVLGIMNFSIYQSFARIPLGVAVTIEFLGPLAVAVASSRRWLDVAWVIMAAGRRAAADPGRRPAGQRHRRRRAAQVARAGPVLGLSTQAAGIAFGLVAAACWAAYILLSRATGRRFSGSSGLVIAMVVAALVVTGPAIAQAGPALLHPSVIAEGLAIGLLSSVIPYRLELEALRRVRAGVFGIWMSLEPAVAALVGLLLLGETLLARQWLAIALVDRWLCRRGSTACGYGCAADQRRSGQPAAAAGLTWSCRVSPAHRPRDARRPGHGRAWLELTALLAPTPAALRRWALAGVITSALIILTGAAVRLSQSGLGCPDWPDCTKSSLAATGATGDPLIHRWVEFGNRLVTVAIFVVAIGVFVAAWQFRAADGRRQRELVWLAAAQPGAIVAQAVLGGIVVITKLNPALVSLHFLASVGAHRGHGRALHPLPGGHRPSPARW